MNPIPITERPPRLFTSKRGAAIALSAWRAGRISVDWGPRRAGLDGIDYDPIHEVDPVPERQDAKLEIVEVTVSLPETAAYTQ